MKTHTHKELIVELLQFLNRKKKKGILVSEYIRITSSRITWTDKRIRALYKAIHETKALRIDYVSVERNRYDQDDQLERISSIQIWKIS